MSKKLIVCSLIVFSLLSCEKEEGEGGQATLKGKVIFRELYSNAFLGIKDSIIAEYPYADERVYLSYGDNDIYDDDFRTDYKGEYKFNGLRKGTYTVYSVPPCKDCQKLIEPAQQTVEITDGKGTTEAPTIYIYSDQSNQ